MKTFGVSHAAMIAASFSTALFLSAPGLAHADDDMRQDIIVTGHYGCGGIAAALASRSFGLIDNWLRHVQDIRERYPTLLAGGGPAAVDRLCELNVLEQAQNVCRTTIVQDAWARGQNVAVHGMIYSVADGLLRDLNFCATSDTDNNAQFERAVAGLTELR